MKSFLKIILTAAAFGLAVSTSLAQPPPGGGGGGGRGGRGGLTIDQIETAVGKLTDVQKPKITAIIDKATKDRQTAMESQDFGKMQEINTEMRKEIRALLTEEQAKKFDEMPQGRGGRRGGQGGPGGPGAGAPKQ